MHKRRAIIHYTTFLDRVSDTVTGAVGSWGFLLAHALWFGLWVGLRIEPFPFGLLTMLVSLEAIFLTTLVMMSQNRQTDRDRRRDDVEAQEVDQLVHMQELLHKINERQLEILERTHKDTGK